MGTQTTRINQIMQGLLDGFSYIDFYRSKKGSASENADISLLHFACRIVPTKTRVGNLITLGFTIPSDTGICPSTTITSVNTDKTQITLSDATYFFSNDETIQIDLPQPITRNIIAKSGNVLTLDSPIVLSTSLIGVLVKSTITQMAIIEGGSIDAGTGTIFRTENAIEKYKDATTPPITGSISFPLLSN